MQQFAAATADVENGFATVDRQAGKRGLKRAVEINAPTPVVVRREVRVFLLYALAGRAMDYFEDSFLTR